MDASKLSNSSTPKYRKHYIPLESNPEVFSYLIDTLGVSSLEFQDILSIDEPDLLSMITRPVLALILVFPTTGAYEKQTAEEEATRNEYTGSGDGEDVIWFKQTINNACGLYGILHAICNGNARNFIEPDSLLAKLLATCVPLAPQDRALALEDSKDLEAAHADAAKRGDSDVPANAEDEVDFHYVCFVQSHRNGRIYEMDGDKKGPVDTGVKLREDEDLLSECGVGLVRKFFQREKGENMNFSLLALVPSD